ncbi:hypothetical protein Dimus_008649 [Dionaea muscipula]
MGAVVVIERVAYLQRILDVLMECTLGGLEDRSTLCMHRRRIQPHRCDFAKSFRVRDGMGVWVFVSDIGLGDLKEFGAETMDVVGRVYQECLLRDFWKNRLEAEGLLMI